MKPLIMATANCHQLLETKSLALIDPPALEFTTCIDERLTDRIPLEAANGTPKVSRFFFCLRSFGAISQRQAREPRNSRGGSGISLVGGRV